MNHVLDCPPNCDQRLHAADFTPLAAGFGPDVFTLARCSTGK